jgi:peroxiredoxin
VRLQTALEELGGTVIGPAVDSGSPGAIRAFAREQRINYPLWVVSDEIAATRFGAPGYPFTMLIDRNGIVRRTYIGARTERILLRDVGDLLAHGPSGRAAAD